MKKWKIYIAVGMAVTMTLGSVLTVSAAALTEEEKQRYEDDVIEFDEVEYLISNYNMTVKLNNRTLDSMGDASAAGAEEVREAAEALEDSYDELYATLDMLKTHGDKTDPDYGDNVANLTSSLGSMKAMVRQLEKQADSMENGSSIDKKMVEIQMNMAQATLVNTVQGLYPAYYQIEEGISQIVAALDIYNQNYQKAVRSRDLGLATVLDVDSLQLQIKAMENNLKQLENQKENLLQTICILIGRDYDANITLGALPAPDYEYAANINVNNDLQRAIGNNYNLMYARREVGTYNSSVDKKLKLEEIETNEQNVASNLNQQYQAVQMSQQTLAQEQAALEQEQIKLDQAQRKYDLGMISKLDYDQQKLAYDNQASTVQTEEMNLFWAIESYKWIVKGL